MNNHSPEQELNFENSVTEKLPALFNKIDEFKHDLTAEMEETGIIPAELIDSSGTLRITKQTEKGLFHVSIATDPETGKYSQIRVAEQDLIPEPSGDFMIVYEDSTYSFTEKDGVNHLDSSVMNEQYMVGARKEDIPTPTESKDDQKDLTRLEALLSDPTDYIHFEQVKQKRREILNKPATDSKRALGRVVRKLFGRN